jgi:AAA domain (dynein-related subfamily)
MTMAKSRNARANRTTQRQPPKAKPSANGRTPAELIAKAAAALPEEQQTAPVESAPEQVSDATLRTAWEDAQRLRTAAEQREAAAADAERAAQRRADELEQAQRALDERAQALDAGEQVRADAEAALAERRQALDERDADLAEREAELAKGSEALMERVRSLAREETAQQRLRMELESQQALVAEERKLLDEHVDQRTAAAQERFTAEVEALEQRLAQARRDRDELDERLREAERRTTAIGGRRPEEVLAELEALREERRALLDELATRPAAEERSRLEGLARANAALTEELETVRRAHESRQAEALQLRTLTADHAYTKDLLEANELRVKGYRAAIEELRADFDHLVEQQQARTPFALMSAMDADEELGEPPAAMTRPASLERFVEDVRTRIAATPQKDGRRLYYGRRDMRLFVAGLACSRLQILQGLSGTGKTSLPLAFAKVIGGGAEAVEVQAGWRDRQDLLGHYNTFERRYDETKFVQALYRAQCPGYADRPYFVVLDEMNLSHPEQYFADVLSAITQDASEVELTNVTLPGAPRRLREGRILQIPRNVWFVGTANHDETTKEFADKTYDRAHVQELSNRPVPFDAGHLDPQPPVSCSALEELFRRAADEHAEAAAAASRYLGERLEPLLTDAFGVRWGNRLEPQIARFVPAAIAAGGDLGEALDHVLATKILRKVRNRHDIALDALDALQDELERTWPQLNASSEPSSSIALLEHERHRMQGGLG